MDKMISDLETMIPKLKNSRLRARLTEIHGFLVHGNAATQKMAAKRLTALLAKHAPTPG